VILVNREHRPSTYLLAIDPPPNEPFNSLKWLYSFGSVIGDHHQYWENRQTTAGQSVDLVGHRVARDIVGSFGAAGKGIKQLMLQDSLGALPAETQQAFLRSMGLPESLDPLTVRRKALGTLAISRFICNILVPERIFPGRRDTDFQLRDAVGALVSPEFMLDMDTDENGMPRDYRLHLPLSIAADTTIFPTAPSLDAWYFGKRDGSDVEVPRQEYYEPEDDPRYVRDPSHGNLWIHRTEADLSDGLVLYLQEKGIAPRPDIATIFPFIPDHERLPSL
jgi:hypothetical protein